jgi:hypothetical protein
MRAMVPDHCVRSDAAPEEGTTRRGHPTPLLLRQSIVTLSTNSPESINHAEKRIDGSHCSIHRGCPNSTHRHASRHIFNGESGRPIAEESGALTKVKTSSATDIGSQRQGQGRFAAKMREKRFLMERMREIGGSLPACLEGSEDHG